MVFKLLRKYFRDEEFEQNKIQLKESQHLLSEYKKFIQEEKTKPEEEKEKVDPDFLVMIWASIGLALSIGVEAVNSLPKPKPVISSVVEAVWLVIALYTVFYIVGNGIFAINLTIDYAKSKANKGYKTFAFTLIIGVTILFIGLLIIAQFGNA